MSQSNSSTFRHPMQQLRPWLFPLGVACLYGLGLMFAPENIDSAVHFCISIFKQLALPMGLAFLTMIIFNRYLSPALVTRFLGQNAGLKGILFSSLAGILSMGPVYAWYPLFKTLQEKGASTFHVANFIGCRSIKPVLLPVMVAYFGWCFTLTFMLMSLTTAFIVAYIVSTACSGNDGHNVNGKPQ